MRRSRLILLTLTVLWPAGCEHGAGTRSWMDWARPKGEPWTILCVELQGPDRISRAEALADELRQVEGIRPRGVEIVHGRRASQVLYGTYYRRIDRDTGKLLIPDELRDDLQRIQLGRFIGARAISSPATDVGEPTWDLEKAEGTYTLLVAVFENTVDFYDRKAAAAAYAKELRGKGYEAYYNHGPRSSEVTVGTFGPDALVQRERRELAGRALIADYSAEVKQLQREENFRYQLRNMRLVKPEGSDGQQFLASRLVRIRPEGEPW
ncbi:MAG: hypothetical protein JSV19_11605 [Phycisphaerales bacterium]|nr:MAG: hypothetical protein JSV19_11605 [Phycisphaerales bacterium]